MITIFNHKCPNIWKKQVTVKNSHIMHVLGLKLMYNRKLCLFPQMHTQYIFKSGKKFYRKIAKTTRRCIKNSMLMISVIFKILLNSIVYFLHIFSSYFRVQGIITVVVFLRFYSKYNHVIQNNCILVGKYVSND